MEVDPRLESARPKQFRKASVALLTALVLSCGGCNCSLGNSSARASIPVSGHENWQIDSETYEIESSFLLPLGPSDLQYTVVWACPDCETKISARGESAARELAKPLFEEIRRRKPFTKIHVGVLGHATTQPNHLGVEIRYSDDPPRGFRVSEPL